jgi:hypothetical protein
MHLTKATLLSWLGLSAALSTSTQRYCVFKARQTARGETITVCRDSIVERMANRARIAPLIFQTTLRYDDLDCDGLFRCEMAPTTIPGLFIVSTINTMRMLQQNAPGTELPGWKVELIDATHTARGPAARQFGLIKNKIEAEATTSIFPRQVAAGRHRVEVATDLTVRIAVPSWMPQSATRVIAQQGSWAIQRLLARDCEKLAYLLSKEFSRRDILIK